MPLWGTAHASDTNKPKFLPADENSDYNKAECYATNAGWVIDGAATGNGNTGADPEVLVAIRGLAGTSASTGLKTPTVTSFRFAFVTGATTDGTASGSGIVSLQITWDEAVTVAGTPTILIDNSVSTDATCAYASGSGTNRLVFTQASGSTLATNDVLTIGGANIALAGGTISDKVVGGTTLAASLVMSGVTAVTHTVTA